ncbi:MAG: pyroglutamyl-peptidase I [Planctomycetota bacterium]|jgi:pyroglutamyl-peptidase
MILVTGFEPFGGLSRNPSGEAALAVRADDVEGAVLSVDYGKVGPELGRLLERPWDAVLLLGVAVRSPVLSLERVAINLRNERRPDNTGETPEGSALVADGPTAYFSTLPIERLHDELSAAGLPVEISLSAGDYLCNASFYLARHALEPRGTPCGFVHVPPTPDVAAGVEPLALEELVRGVTVILDVLRQH